MTVPRTLLLRRLVMPLSGLVLCLLDSGEGAVWELSLPGPGRPLVHVAAMGPNLLVGGYIVPGRLVDSALAVGHVQADAAPTEVRFTTGHLRWRQEATATPLVVGSGLWLAEAVGNYELVVVPERDDLPDHVAPLRLLR